MTDRDVLHTAVDNADHLGQGGLGRGLVDKAFAREVDVVARAHSLQDDGSEQASGMLVSKQASEQSNSVRVLSTALTLSKVPS